MVEADAQPERRYRFLAPVRPYALAKLEGSGDAACARDRLLTWAVTLAEKAGPDTFRGPAKTSVEQLEVEHPNLRAAFEWGLTQPACAVERHRLANGLSQFWQVRGYICEGRAWFEQLVAGLGDIPVPLQVDTLREAGFLAIHDRDFIRARLYLEQGIELAQALGERHQTAVLYTLLSWVFWDEGDLDGADRLCDEALAIFEQTGEDWDRSIALFTRANIAYLRPDYGRARKSIEESLSICRGIGFMAAFARRQVRLGQICHAEGDDERARRCMADALCISRETRDTWGIAMALAGMARLVRHQGQPERAAWLLGATQHYLDAFGVPLWKVDQMEHDRNAAELRLQLGEPAFQAAMDRGAKQAANDLDGALRVALGESEIGDPGPRAPTRERSIPSSVFGEFTPLTHREREVAALVAQGNSNAEIAEALFIGLRTVEAHVTHILNKRGFNSRTQIAAWLATEAAAGSAGVSPGLPRHRRAKRR